MKNKKLVGLVGGMGPLASVDVLDKLFKYSADRYGVALDREYPSVMLFSDGVSDFNEAGLINPTFEDDLTAIIDALEIHKPNILGMACNTAHIFTDTVKRHTQAKFISIIEEAAKEAAKTPITYLVLSSSVTRDNNLYYKELELQSVKYIDIEDDEQAEVNRVISLTMANKQSEAHQAANTLVKKLLDKYPKARGIIAGCTELPIALSKAQDVTNAVIIDPNLCLAKALADEYYQS